MTIKLPIYEIIPKLKAALRDNDKLVLQAPPGAGKTTVVPLELLSEPWLGDKKIIMLEPRRLAARAAAKRMAETLGEEVGESVGYRVRMDSKVGPKTRIEVVTEGVLIRKLQSDPELSGVGLVIFDEFHERSIEADLGLALSLDVQEGLRDDLKLMVMSATLDGEKVAALMQGAPIISSEGRSFEVTHIYLNKKVTGRIENEVASVILRALDEQTGSILVFLPGAGEIERTKNILEEKKLVSEISIAPLYGMMSFKDQDLAILPAPQGIRKIVLATAIAETSLTIEGIRVVIDSGLQRSSAYDVRSGMSGLQTSAVSKASAEQRAGRAGRTENGSCYRLWTEAAGRALIAFNEPEIKRVDLVPLALDLALWGISEPSLLKWLDLPDAASFGRACSLLMSLGALDENGAITEHGKIMARFSMHPRFAHMILKADTLGHGLLALNIAALLQEKDLLHLKPEMRTADLRLRLEALEHVSNGEAGNAKRLGCNIGLAKNILRQTKIWQKNYRISKKDTDLEKAGLCLSYAFPDRIGALREGGSGTYLLSGGRGAKLGQDDPLGSEKFLAVGHLDLGQRDAKIYLAAPVFKTDLEDNFEDLIYKDQAIKWDDRREVVVTQNKLMLDQMPLGDLKIKNTGGDEIKQAMIAGIRKIGMDAFSWDKKTAMLRARIALINEFMPDTVPDLSDQNLLDTLEDWLGPYLINISSRAALSKLELYSILKNKLNWEMQQKLEQLTPTHFKVPSGSNVAIDYGVCPPSLPVKLQEMFGATENPNIMDGKINLKVHLLSPARRPLQITTDLGGFWQNSYPEIKKEMKGRYPKHPWPDDPLQSVPTKRLKGKK